MLKHIRSLLGSILILLMIVGVSLYFYQKNRSETEAVRIYGATTPAVKKALPIVETSSEETQRHAEHNHAEHHPTPEYTSTLEHSEELRSVAPVENPGTLHTRTAEEAEKAVPSVFEGLSEEEASLWFQEQFEILGKQMAEKYPEIARVTELTPEEFHERYSTDEAKDAIRELALQAKDEFFADFRENLFLLPRDVRVSVLDETWTLVAKNWGEQTADTILTQIRAELGM